MSRKLRIPLCLALAGAAALLVFHAAFAAPPPPPRFYGFTITNHTGADLTGVTVQLWQATPTKVGKYDTLTLLTTLTLTQIPDGKTFRIGTPEAPEGIEGIAQICLTAATCAGKTLHGSLTLTTTKTDYDMPPDGHDEYAGICQKKLDGTYAAYSAHLEFGAPPDPGAPIPVTLDGHERWGTGYFENLAPIPGDLH